MKKIIQILVVAITMISLPSVCFAQNEQTEATKRTNESSMIRFDSERGEMLDYTPYFAPKYTQETYMGDWRDSVLPFQVVINTDSLVMYDSKNQCIEGFSDLLPIGSRVIESEPVDPKNQRPEYANKGLYFAHQFLVELPFGMYAWDYLGADRKIYESNFKNRSSSGIVIIPGARLVYVSKTYGHSSAPTPMNDPSFTTSQNHLYYNPTAIAAGVIYLGWQHAYGYVPKLDGKVKTALLDAGFKMTHNDAVNVHWTNPNEIAGNSIDDDLNGYTDDDRGWDNISSDNDPTDISTSGHGAHTGGIMGARNNNSNNICGIRRDTGTLMILRVLDANLTGNDFATASAYTYARLKKASVVNMSLGGTSLPLLEAAIAAGVPEKMIAVASSGNAGMYDPNQKPANTDSVISVGATNFGGTSWSNSNWSNKLDIMAPGVNVISLGNASNSAVLSMSGTSMAAPHVAAICAFIKSYDTSITTAQMIDIIHSLGTNTVPTATTAYGSIHGLDTFMKKWCFRDTVMTFTACSGMKQLIQSRYLKFVDSMKYGIPGMMGDSVNTNVMLPGTYYGKFAWKSEPRSGVYYSDTVNFRIVINPSSGGQIVPEDTTSISADTTCSGSPFVVNFKTNYTSTVKKAVYRNGVYMLTTTANSIIETISTQGLYKYQYVALLDSASSGCWTKARDTSFVDSVYIKLPVTPAVNISAAPGNTICSSSPVTFTANPTNGGTAPIYQWKLNGSPVGTNSATYTNGSLANGDVILCDLTSSATCASPVTITSNNIAMSVTPTVVPGINITSSATGPICPATPITFTANPTNGGTAPTYQWKVNGGNVGTNSPTYTSTTLANGDIVTCVMNSSLTCVTLSSVTSNSISTTVNTANVPSISIVANPSTSICAGTSVTFTANSTNGGSMPTYQWKRNGSPVGTNSATYTNGSLANNDVIVCMLTSNITCPTPATVTSNTINMNVSVKVAIPSFTILSHTLFKNAQNQWVAPYEAVVPAGMPTGPFDWYINGIKMGTTPSNAYDHVPMTLAADTVYAVYKPEGCWLIDSAISDTIRVSSPLGVAAPLGLPSNINPYPNPASDYVMINDIPGGWKVGVYTMNGSLVVPEQIAVEGVQTRVNLVNLSPAVYILLVVNPNNGEKHPYRISKY